MEEWSEARHSNRTTLALSCALHETSGRPSDDAPGFRCSSRLCFEPIDAFYVHVGGADAFARRLKIAATIRADGDLRSFVQERYASWDSGIGARIESGEADFASLESYMLEKGEIAPNASGRQEMLEHLLNRYL